MKMILLVSVLLSLLAMNFLSCSKDSPSEPEGEPTLAERLQEALDNGLESYNGIGVSAAVIMPDGETWVGVSGVSHGTTAITADMPFAAGSITKMFTATTILQLIEEGELTLDDSLYEWLSVYPYVDSTITIRQLLNHTSGLYDFIDNPDLWDAVFAEPSKVWTPEEMILAFMSEPVFPKGTDWNYSTAGYALLRMIIKEISGLELSTVYSDRFWTPLGLVNSFTLIGGEALSANTAHGWWDLDGDGTYDDFFYWPRAAWASGIGGEVFSTAEDLAKWSRALFHDRTVLSQQSLDQMLTFHSPCTGEEFFSAGYGLGAAKFQPNLFNGLEVYGHTGNAPGYAAACLYLPDYGVCIGFTDNTEEGNAMSTIADLMNVITSHLEETP
jgi:D-alanyl-D-alanine carboxypeptidase